MNIKLKKLIVEACKSCVDKANTEYKIKLEYPILCFDLTSTTAGRSYSSMNTIHLNMYLLKHNTEQFLKDTLVHEVAHLVEAKVFGTMKHGKNWKSIMKVFGIKNPKSLHEYDTTNMPHKRKVSKMFEYSCACGKQSLSKVRHENIKLNKKLYKCNKCGKILVNA